MFGSMCVAGCTWKSEWLSIIQRMANAACGAALKALKRIGRDVIDIMSWSLGQAWEPPSIKMDEVFHKQKEYLFGHIEIVYSATKNLVKSIGNFYSLSKTTSPRKLPS